MVQDDILRNLHDAGCPEQLIQQVVSLQEPEERLCLLGRYRKDLLARVHEETAKLDCLDFLIYNMRQAAKS